MGTVHTVGETDARIDIEKNEVQVSLSQGRSCWMLLMSMYFSCSLTSSFVAWGFQQKEPTLMPGMHRSKSKHELKLLEKIPENAEATVVLVGELSPTNANKTTRVHPVIVCVVDGFVPRCSRQCGLPGAAHHGVCEAAGGGGAGVRPGGPCACQVPVCSAWTPHHQHGLPPNRTLHLHTDV